MGEAKDGQGGNSLRALLAPSVKARMHLKVIIIVIADPSSSLAPFRA
jgi:hypothetical protein